VDTTEIAAGALAADAMAQSAMTVSGGVTITRTARAFDAAELTRIAALIDRRRGGVLSSGMEYPGRYTRWHMAYVNPPVEIACRGRQVTARALNDRGLVLLPAIRAAMVRVGVEQPVADDPADPDNSNRRGVPGSVTVYVPEGEGTFTEEERSRRPTVFSVLREITAAFGCADPHLGLYGAFGYDLAFQFEPLREVIDRSDDQRDLVLHLPDEIWVVDLRRDEAVRYSYEFAVADAGPGGPASTAGLPRETSPTPEPALAAGPLPPPPAAGRYAEVVEQAKQRFRRGDLFEVVPGHTFYERCASPSGFYERLRERNPAPFEFLFNLGDGEYLVGASPEMYVRVNGDRVETCPISGTIARGADPLEDAANIARLLGSAKEESELTMCTDVDRNDKSRVCVPGTVQVIGRRQIEMYSRLIHTVDHIEGRLRPDLDALDAFLTHMWAVTVTGAPKAWAMQFIEDHEESRRRWYGGAVGKVGFDGSMNTGLTLRTARIRDGVAAVRVGATLLYDSDPDSEERETHIKARALLETLREVEEARLAAERAVTGPDEDEIAGDGSADYPDTPVAAGPGEVPAARPLRIVLVDHQDSFVHTLADYFRQHDAEVTTLRAGFPATRLDELAPDLVVLSPGPGRPGDFRCDELLTELDARGLPAFGVCLGLQAMVEHAGGELSLLPEPQHGKPGRIQVRGEYQSALFSGLPEEFTAARYHSLYATEADVKGGFTVTAATPDGVVMAIEDDAAGRWAVQFHPESILTAAGRSGHRIIANVLARCRAKAGVAA
jgi:anthranilate synthase